MAEKRDSPPPQVPQGPLQRVGGSIVYVILDGFPKIELGRSGTSEHKTASTETGTFGAIVT